MTEKLHAYVEKLKEKNEAWVASVTEGHGEVTDATLKRTPC